MEKKPSSSHLPGVFPSRITPNSPELPSHGRALSTPGCSCSQLEAPRIPAHGMWMWLRIPDPNQENADREQEMMDISWGFGTSLGTANTPEPPLCTPGSTWKRMESWNIWAWKRPLSSSSSTPWPWAGNFSLSQVLRAPFQTKIMEFPLPGVGHRGVPPFPAWRGIPGWREPNKHFPDQF